MSVISRVDSWDDSSISLGQKQKSHPFSFKIERITDDLEKQNTKIYEISNKKDMVSIG